MAVTAPKSTGMIIDLGAVIVAVTDDRPLVLVRHGPFLDEVEARSVARGFDVAGDALPSGPFDATRHRTLDRGLRETVTGRDWRDAGLCRAALYVWR